MIILWISVFDPYYVLYIQKLKRTFSYVGEIGMYTDKMTQQPYFNIGMAIA